MPVTYRLPTLAINKYACYETDSKIFEAFYQLTRVVDFKEHEIFFYSLKLFNPKNFFYLIVLHNLALQ